MGPCSHFMQWSSLHTITITLTYTKLHFVQCTVYTSATIWIYRRLSVKLHDSLNLDQSHASQGGELITVKACERVVERDRRAHTSLRMLAALFCMEEPLSMFILIQWDSCGHLEPAYAYVSPRLSKPAPFIILQQPCSNWAASPPAVTHHLLHIEPEEIQMYLVRHRPVVAHQPRHLNCICGQLSPSVYTELIPGTALSFFPRWYLPVSLSTVVWKPGNDVAHQFNCRRGYNARGLVASSREPLSSNMARTLNIPLPWVPCLLKFCGA